MLVWLDIKIKKNKKKKKKKDIRVCLEKYTLSSKKMGWLGSRPRPNPSSTILLLIVVFLGWI